MSVGICFILLWLLDHPGKCFILLVLLGMCLIWLGLFAFLLPGEKVRLGRTFSISSLTILGLIPGGWGAEG